MSVGPGFSGMLTTMPMDAMEAGMAELPENRRIYRTPKVEHLGTIAQLAQGGVDSTQSDSGMNNMRPP
jgi:hypothetical protein